MTNQRGQKLVGLVNTLFLFFSSFTSHSYSYTHTCQGTAQHKLIFTDIIHNISAFKCLKTVTHLLYILNDVLALSQMLPTIFKLREISNFIQVNGAFNLVTCCNYQRVSGSVRFYNNRDNNFHDPLCFV